MRKCSKCKKNKKLKELCIVKGKARNYCKVCHAKCERLRWNNLPFKEKQKRSKKYYKNRLAKEDKFSLDEHINNWCHKQINRTTESKFKDRKNLDKEVLKKLCYIAIKKFPYISFYNKRGYSKMALAASIDRINPNKGYTNNNIQILPLWLNSAKLDLTLKQLNKLIKQYIK